MDIRKIILLFALIFTGLTTAGQHLAATIPEVKELGISIEHLDKIYKSAVHSDTSRAVFKTDSAQQELMSAYIKLLQDFGKFIQGNNFQWGHTTKGWNRIYFSGDGCIDYFLYVFKEQNVSPEDRLSPEKKAEFNRLLNLFIRDYKFPLHPGIRFAQCSPVTYLSENDKR